MRIHSFCIGVALCIQQHTFMWRTISVQKAHQAIANCIGGTTNRLGLQTGMALASALLHHLFLDHKTKKHQCQRRMPEEWKNEDTAGAQRRVGRCQSLKYENRTSRPPDMPGQHCDPSPACALLESPAGKRMTPDLIGSSNFLMVDDRMDTAEDTTACEACHTTKRDSLQMQAMLSKDAQKTW